MNDILNAEACEVCWAPVPKKNETTCSKVCRQVLKRHKTSKVQYLPLPVSNDIELVLRRKARATGKSIERLLADAVERGWVREKR